MIDFIEACVADKTDDSGEGYDEQRIMIKALSSVLPVIIKNELTPRQNLCLRLFYVHRKTQLEIARQLKLSQPTVSRHIKTGRDITNKFLNYCYYSVGKANEQWLKME